MNREAWSGKRELGAMASVLALAFVLAPATFADDPADAASPVVGVRVPKGTPPPSAPQTPEAAGAPAAPAEVAPNFTLPNAQAGITRVKWPREKAVFLTFGEQASQTAIQAWSGKMKERYGATMEFVGVAWLARVPKEMHGAAEAVIKATYPDVLMDKSGSCAERYQCKPGAVNAFVIAPDGAILKRIHEPMTDERFAEVEKLVEPFTKKN